MFLTRTDLPVPGPADHRQGLAARDIEIEPVEHAVGPEGLTKAPHADRRDGGVGRGSGCGHRVKNASVIR